MKYLKLKIWVLVVSIVLLSIGYLFSGKTDFTLCNSINTQCGFDQIWGFGLPLYNLMQFFVASVVISFLMKNNIFKVWKFVFIVSVIFIFIELLNISATCQNSFPVFCTRADNASIDGLLFFVLTLIFVIISLIWSFLDYINKKKSNLLN